MRQRTVKFFVIEESRLRLAEVCFFAALRLMRNFKERVLKRQYNTVLLRQTYFSERPAFCCLA